MQATAAPRCEATISPDLLRLLRGLAPAPLPKVTPGPETTPVVTGPAEAGAGRADDAPGPTATPWPGVVLQVDGERPCRFRGLLICHSRSRLPAGEDPEAGHFVRELRLYLSERRDVVAHAVCRPVGSVPARAVHRCAEIANLDDLARLLRSAGPRGCYDLVAGTGHVRLPDLTHGLPPPMGLAPC